MKNLLIVLFMIFYVLAFSQNLEITGTGFVSFVQASPDENWIIIPENNGFNIYTEDFQLVDNFNLDTQSLFFFSGAGRDFDEDNNIEILYQVLDSNYISSFYLKDIETGAMQVSYVGNSSSSYCVGPSGYLGGERIFTISRYQNNVWDASYIYRSGVQSYAPDVNIINNLSQLNQNYPNPFNPTTTIKYSLDVNSNISLNIYNIKGQLVKQLVSAQLSAGEHSVVWDGKNDKGKSVGSGAYLYELKVNGKAQTMKKCLLLK